MYVYFIRQGRTGPIKMGVGASAQERLASLQVGNPNELRLIGKTTVEGYDTAVALEARLHQHFSLHRIRGEWFAPTKELLDTIAELADPPRELIQPDPPAPLTEDERWEAMARRVRVAVSGKPSFAEEAS